MKTIENWFLRVADSDLTWVGLGWLRPAKHTQIGLGYVLFSSILLGLPGIALGGGAICLAFGRVDAGVWLWLFLLVMMVEVPLHLVFAYFWNLRARQLERGVEAA